MMLCYPSGCVVVWYCDAASATGVLLHCTVLNTEIILAPHANVVGLYDTRYHRPSAVEFQKLVAALILALLYTDD